MEMDKKLVREIIAKRVAQEFHDGYVRNLYIKKFSGKVCRVIIINDEL